MNADAKRAFIVSLTDSVRNALLARVDDMPADWDGHELRRYIADQFEREAWTWSDQRRKRRADYRNAVATIGRL